MAATLALLLASCGLLRRGHDESSCTSSDATPKSSGSHGESSRCGNRRRSSNAVLAKTVSTIHTHKLPPFSAVFSNLAILMTAIVLTTQHIGISSTLMSSSNSSPSLSPINAPSTTLPLPPTAFAPFNYSLATEDNYKHPSSHDYYCTSPSDIPFCASSFHDIRTTMDYRYHSVYNCDRQLFQDSIIESMLGSTWIRDTLDLLTTCSTPKRNMIVFTAGVMGAGKSHVVRSLHSQGRFPAHAFVTVDPDEIRRHMPEFEQYIQQSPELAGELTRKEAGFMAEILTEAALRRGQNVLVDGTLRDSQWYQSYLNDLRHRYPQLRTGILHITAPREAVLERATSRAQATGRVVPRDLLEQTMREVPRSVQLLSQLVDFSVELHNAPGTENVEIRTPGMTWDLFQQTWQQTCAKKDATTSRRLLFHCNPLFAGSIGRYSLDPRPRSTGVLHRNSHILTEVARAQHQPRRTFIRPAEQPGLQVDLTTFAVMRRSKLKFHGRYFQ